MGNQNPVPGLVLPAPQEGVGSVRNNNAVLRWVKSVSPRAYWVDTAMYSPNGTNPPSPPTDSYLFGGGVQQVSFSGGVGTITFPQAFPNGVLTAQASAMFQFDNVLCEVTYPYAGGLQTLVLNAYDITIAGPADSTIPVNYEVIGW